MCSNPMKPKAHKVIKIVKDTDIEWTFRIEMDNLPHAGQFYMLSLPRIGEMPISVSGIGPNWIDMTIRSVGRVSDKVHDLGKGSTIFLRGPYGNGFSLSEFKQKHLVIVAGGSGVSPVKPIIDYCYNNYNDLNKLDLIFGFKGSASILFKDSLELWKGKFNTILTIDKEEKGWSGNTGLVTKYVEKLKFVDKANVVVVLVGPSIMMSKTAEKFVECGIKENQILVSYERRMSCGIGKCGHCRINDNYVCLDGPVFRYDVSKKLID